MRNKGEYYSYMACYFYDMVSVHKYSDHIFDSIRGNGFTIKETSAPDYFLGGYFRCFKDPKTNIMILTWGSKTYVKRMVEKFKNTFVFDPSKKHSVMPPE